MKKVYVSTLIAVSLAFAASLATWLFNYPGRRSVMIFRSHDTGGLIVEARFLPTKPVQGRETLFVDELLLGPATERCQPIFSAGTRTISAFARDGIFYVNISAEALSERSGAVNIKEGSDLFRKNILWNFSGAKEVELFIDSKYAY